MESQAVLLQIPDHARSRIQAIRASTRKQDRLHLLRHIDRVQQIGLASARRGAPHIHSRRGALIENQNRASGRPARIREMPYSDALHIRNAAARILFRHRSGRQRSTRRQNRRVPAEFPSSHLNHSHTQLSRVWGRRFRLPTG